MDTEYGKFKHQHDQMMQTLTKLIAAVTEDDLSESQQESILVNYRTQLAKCFDLNQLKNFTPLIQFLKQFYAKEFEAINSSEGVE